MDKAKRTSCLEKEKIKTDEEKRLDELFERQLRKE